MDEPKKRGRGRPPKETPKTPIDPKNPLEVIRQPKPSNVPQNVEIPEGDNNKYTSLAVAIMQLPKIDLKAPNTAMPRITEYFQLCADCDIKPAVNGLSLCLGLDRRRLWEIKTDQDYQAPIHSTNKEAIKYAYDSLEFMWETYMQNGKINPVSGIFLGKNYFGYKDQQEYVLTPNAQGLSGADAATIEAKYAELPED